MNVDPSRFAVVLELVRKLLGAWGYSGEHVPTSLGRVHLWRASGSGPLPPVLVIHGLGSAALNWVPVLELLRPHVSQILAVDLPGHGFSDRPQVLTNDALRDALIEALDRSGHPPSLVVGHSLGGAAALRYVLARPRAARGLLLFSPAGAPLDREQLDGVRSLFHVDSYDDAVRFLRALHARPAELRARLAAPFVQASLQDPVLRGWLATVQPYEDGDPGQVYVSPAEIGAITAPMRVVWGLADRILPFTARDYWQAHLPLHATLIQPEGIGHTPFLDDRKWTAEEIRMFAAQISGRGR